MVPAKVKKKKLNGKLRLVSKISVVRKRGVCITRSSQSGEINIQQVGFVV